MTDKEIYKGRAEGLNWIAEKRALYNSNHFFELLDFAFQISKENLPNYKLHREEKILEKIKYRKALNVLFGNDKL
ncbi:MAG: hypothetical protein AB1521_12775 [Bacteroidota bacterium]